MAEDDIEKTAFVTPGGEYEFLKVLFGNSGATLVWCMRKLLSGWENVEHYVGDILVHTHN